MGLSATLALASEGKDAASLATHFDKLQRGSASQEEEFNAANFWRVSPLAPTKAEHSSDTEPAKPNPDSEELQRVNISFEMTDDVDPNDAGKVLWIDDDSREHLELRLAVGATTELRSPVGRRWHVRSEQSNGLLHSFTATFAMAPVVIRFRKPLTLIPPEKSLRQRLAEFEAAFKKEHGRAPTPADGPSLPKEVLQMYHEHTLSLQMKPEEMAGAVAQLNRKVQAKAEVQAKRDAEAKAREEARAKQWEEWEAKKDNLWAEAKVEARDQRAELVCDERVLTGAATWVKADEAPQRTLTKEEYVQRAHDKLGLRSRAEAEEEWRALEEAAEEAEWARRGGGEADILARDEAAWA